MDPTDAEIGAVPHAITFCLAWLKARDYEPMVRSDMSAWVAAMQDAPGMTVVNPTFDPRWHGLSEATCFWIDVRRGRQTVATIAARLLCTDDYFELLRSMRLLFDPPRPHLSRWDITLADNTPRLSGRVGHEGGMWIHPEHRRIGMSVILPHLVRAIAFDRWALDWQTGIGIDAVGTSGLLETAYGMSHVQLCYVGPSPVPIKKGSEDVPIEGPPIRLYSAHLNRNEILHGLAIGAIRARLPLTASSAIGFRLPAPGSVHRRRD